ncbi:MAG: hypothetical protein ABT05_04370 [Lautropia sp. SCN 66-9]|nr:MAG: hypothetical protein ABT05_04370 [Lautropia sp. SCN 66-9]
MLIDDPHAGRRRRRYAHVSWMILAVLPVGLCALLVMPASWLVAALSIPGPLLAVEAKGSLWSGSAALAIGRAELRRPIDEPLRWELRFTGGPRLVATHPALAGELDLALSWRGLRAAPQSLRLPAGLLGAVHPKVNLLMPEGELLLSWPETVIGLGSPRQGTELADLRWNSAGSWLTPVRPMGAYRVVLSQGSAGQVEIGLSSLGSPVLLQGKGSYSADQGLRLDGTARADPATTREARVELRTLFEVLGASAANHYRFSLQ